MKSRFFEVSMKRFNLKKYLHIVATACLLSIASSAYAEPPSKPIEFVDLDGKASLLSDYKGKWVILNLWATWCPPCLVEIPDLIMFHEAHKDKDAIVIGVNYEDNDPKKVKAFADSQMINYDVVRFKQKIDGKTSPLGPLHGLPTTYMVAPDGTVVAARTGMVDQKMLEEFIERFSKMNK
ncbi:TlpA disulfide reductase family protein [Thiomicrorhabdus sp. ZW0627]|uniref:TlpA disulfide reductase family protein n=1 Tax=Thiomicrorhabdus sp. ZW0627 TaxID=3039774 RepID=UPI0024363216|nr:TlpA disulfide reductase family protein [Thiomicrorhabdus sp. ZW0627]MDG6773277.1 TlpA disulfide reductase family protein [Thiomicrorhabdus sp. ZW0627]